MDKRTKITLEELLRRKEQMLNAKKTKKTAELYVESLDGVIEITQPSDEVTADATAMGGTEGDTYAVYNCVTEPLLKSKELQEQFGCNEPTDIVKIMFEPGEVSMIAAECIKLAGYANKVERINKIKN